MEQNTDMVIMSGQTDHITKEIGKIMFSKVTVSICGPMEENILVAGKTIKWMAKVNSFMNAFVNVFVMYFLKVFGCECVVNAFVNASVHA